MHVVRTFKMYCLSNFQIYNTVLFTIVTTLHILSPELTVFKDNPVSKPKISDI